MKIDSISHFKRAFKNLPKDVQALFLDKMHQFQDNWQQPSFRVKRIQGTNSIWEGSLNMSIRFTSEWRTDDEGDDVCIMRTIGNYDHCSK